MTPLIPAHILATLGQRPLLRGLLAVRAGFAAGSQEPLPRAGTPARYATFLYCVRGSGWCELAGRLHTIRPGDFLVLAPGTSHACGTRVSDPWSVHWVQATGELLPDYLNELTPATGAPLLQVGEDPRLVRLFNEIVRCLQRGSGPAELLRASTALGYMLGLLIEKRQESTVADVDTMQKVADAIIYMSEHLEEPLRMTALARQASLSSAYFGGLFKAQTGCAPREYLHLLRMHRACQLLRASELSIKQIAARLGYQDPFHFSRQFKAFHGLSPSEYREARVG
jgi:AraC family transcriptional regulator, arabinose operon regulatory protein